MTSNATLVSNSGADKINISDHYLVYVTLKLKVLKLPPKYIISRSYKCYDPVSFTDDLKRIPWNETMSIDDVNAKLDHFYAHLFRVLDLHAPIRKKGQTATLPVCE